MSEVLMSTCSVCGTLTKEVYGGKCLACLVKERENERERKLDAESRLPDYQINTPLGKDLVKVFRIGNVSR